MDFSNGKPLATPSIRRLAGMLSRINLENYLVWFGLILIEICSIAIQRSCHAFRLTGRVRKNPSLLVGSAPGWVVCVTAKLEAMVSPIAEDAKLPQKRWKSVRVQKASHELLAIYAMPLCNFAYMCDICGPRIVGSGWHSVYTVSTWFHYMVPSFQGLDST